MANVALLDADGNVVNVIVVDDPEDTELLAALVEADPQAQESLPVTEETGTP